MEEPFEAAAPSTNQLIAGAALAREKEKGAA
jgi:hypothetical protein